MRSRALIVGPPARTAAAAKKPAHRDASPCPKREAWHASVEPQAAIAPAHGLTFPLLPAVPAAVRVATMGRFVFLMAVAVWLGTVVSFSYVILPTVLAERGGEARPLLHRLFPRYYLVGIVCGLIALAVVSLAPPSPLLPLGERVRLAFPVVVSLLCTLVAQRLLLPRLAARRSDDEGYARLHRFSAMLNSTVLAMLILAVAAIATR